MSSKNTEAVTKARSLRILRSRAKAKLKELLSGQSSRDETVVESSSNTPSTLPSSSTAIPDAESQNQTSSDPPMSVSGLTDNLDSSVVQNKVSDTIESSNVWVKAYKAATPDTRKWIESFPNMTISQNVGDQSWVGEILEAVRALEKKHQDSSLRITVGQKEIALGDYVVPTVKWLTLIGDISTQFAPAPSGIVWSAMKALLQVPETGIEETAAVLATTTRVIDILRRGKVYEVVFTEDNTAPELLQNLRDALLTLYAKSLDLLAYAARHLKNQYRQILEWITNPGHATSLIAELTQCETELSRTVECCEVARSANADETHTKLLLNLHDSVDQIDDRMRQLFDKMEIREMLEALDYFSDVKFGEQHQKKVESRTPGTGMWLLAHSKFKKWEQTDESSILWLQGAVGMGKSFLASSVIDHFLVNNATSNTPNRKNNHGFAYFYCERGTDELREPISILRSYVRQLSMVPCYPKCMQKELIELYQESRKQGAKLSTKVCKDQIFASANLYPRTILILDGLDECDANERGALIKILAELIQHAKNPVKLFISSRREQDIAKQLGFSRIIEISARDNKEDIQKFVDERIEKTEETGKWLSIPQDLKNKIKDTLCAKSDGMFRWTYLQMDQLSELRQAKQIEERLGKLPKTLNDAYKEIIQMIEKNGETEILERAVKWIMCAQGHLTTGEILDAIRLAPSSDGSTLCVDSIPTAEETLLGICRHLVVKDSHSKLWKFPHASVIEYFEEVHQWNLERAHSFVARICLLYLLDDECTQKVKSTVKRRWSTDLSEHPGHSKHSKHSKDSDDSEDICPYILGNWFVHVLALEKPELHEVEISKLLERFLGIDKSPRQSSQYYQAWIKLIIPIHSLPRRWYSMYFPLVNFYPLEDPIFGICIFGFYYLIQDYWKSGIDVLSVNKWGIDLLSIAAQYGHLKICEKLIELGSDVNRLLSSHPNGSTALSNAIKKRDVNMVRYLISLGADPNLPLKGHSALCASISASPDNNLECTEILLDAKADPNRPCGPRCEFLYPLGFAVLRGNIDVAKILLRKGADVNLFGETGDYGSALEAAAHQSNEEKCKLLIEYGADVNADLKVGKYGSALVAAAFHNNDQICKLLIEHGADVNVSLFGKYPSALAAAEGGGIRARRVYELLSRLEAKSTTDISSLLSKSNIDSFPISRRRRTSRRGIISSHRIISSRERRGRDFIIPNTGSADSLDLHRQRLAN